MVFEFHENQRLILPKASCSSKVLICVIAVVKCRLVRLHNEPEDGGSDGSPSSLPEHSGKDFDDGKSSQEDTLGSCFLVRPSKQDNCFLGIGVFFLARRENTKRQVRNATLAGLSFFRLSCCDDSQQTVFPMQYAYGYCEGVKSQAQEQVDMPSAPRLQPSKCIAVDER